MKSLLFSLLFLIPQIVSAQPDSLWSQLFGNNSSNVCRSMIKTTDDGFAILGSFIDGDPTNSDFWLIKTDDEGEISWSQTYGGDALDLPYCLIQTEDGGYALVGDTRSFDVEGDALYLIKTDDEGEEEWSYIYSDGNYISSHSLVQTEDENYILAGETFGDEEYAFIASISSEGDSLWFRTFTTEDGILACYSMVPDRDGGFALAGVNRDVVDNRWWTRPWFLKTDENGVEVFSRIFDFDQQVWLNSLVTVEDGWVLAGHLGQVDPIQADGFFLKIDREGEEIWSETYGGDESESINSIISAAGGGYTAAGFTSSFGAGERDVWLVRIDERGEGIWSTTFGGGDQDQCNSLVQVDDLGYVLGSETESFGEGLWDIWLLKTTPDTFPSRIHHVPEEYVTIQEAIEACENSDTVLVDPGIYTENINFSGKNIVVGSYFMMTGNRNFVDTTVIDGDENGSVVTFEAGSSNETVLTGFTVRNGRSENGGGVFCEDSDPILKHCIITGNSATTNGGAIYCVSSSPTIANCTISYNSADEAGGAVYCDDGTNLNINNTILWNNSPQEICFCRINEPNGIEFSYSDLMDGEDGIITNDNGEISWLDGNIDTDPSFINEDGGNFHLSRNSPCIDAGNPDNDLDPDLTRADIGAHYYHQKLRHVPGDYETIQEAVDVSIEGDTILVQPGEYVENLNFLGKDIVIGSLFLTTANTEYINSTMIDGNSDTSVVLFENGESENAQLIGFTIRNGASTFGAGINCFNNSSPTIKYCRIIQNHASFDGGGIRCANSNAQILDCYISENHADRRGGGVSCTVGEPVLSNCTITGNSANEAAGIECRTNCDAVISNCFIHDNIAESSGGGISLSNCNPVISYSTIYNNEAETHGGGIHCYRSNPVIINCTISGNRAFLSGGIVCNYYSNPTCINSILWGNFPQEIYFYPQSDSVGITVSHCDVTGGEERIANNDNGEVNWLDGNIDSDPFFLDPDNGNFNFHPRSPCIDAGTAFFVWEEDTLLNLSDDQYAGDAPDMGAIEYGYVAVSTESSIQPHSLVLFHVYPNPFNAVTTISYTISELLHVELVIYDIYGRLVKTLFTGIRESGVHRITWNGSNLPSGLYFVRLKASNQVFTQKVMLIR